MSCCGAPLTPQEYEELDRMVAARVSAFAATLRANAFAVGMREAQDAAALIARGLCRSPAAMRSAFRHLFSANKANWEKFDGLFDAFWIGRGVKHRSKVAGVADFTPGSSRLSIREWAEKGAAPAATDQVPSGDQPIEADGEGRMEGASAVETITKTDFRKFSNPEEIERAHAIAADLARAMRTRLTRRDLARRRGERIDLRRTIHANIDHGGVPIDRIMRRRKDKPLRLVILLDASGSMSAYTGTFIRFIHGVLDEFREAEAFLFDTRLAHVSAAMRERDAARALDRLGLMARGAGGGTRIGESLQVFNRAYARRVIHSRTCVMIVSDGYETGDPALLGREMAALARRCRRIVWLNPMMGWEGYAPTAAGMQAALPHIDLMAPANTLQSLAALEPYLARL